MIESVRINYHADDKSGLVGYLLAGLVDLHAGCAWLERHWLHGPHLRILWSTNTFSSVAPKAYLELARRAIRHRPSATAVDEGTWLQTSARLGELELVPGPYSPVHPDNTAWIETVTPEDTFLRDEETYTARGQLIRSALTDQDPVELAAGSRRVAEALTAMTALATSYQEGGIARGYLAFLSHWKDFFLWNDTAHAVESALSDYFARQRTKIIELVSRGIADTNGHWATWSRDGYQRTVGLSSRGLILPYPHVARLERARAMSPELGRRWGGDNDRPYSDFHVDFRQLDYTKLGNGDAFSTYRFQINALFEVFSVLGVAPSERYATAYLLTRAVEDIEGINWRDLIETRRAKQAEDPTASPTLPWKG